MTMIWVQDFRSFYLDMLIEYMSYSHCVIISLFALQHAVEEEYGDVMSEVIHLKPLH